MNDNIVVRVEELSIERLDELLDAACKHMGEAFRDGNDEKFQLYAARRDALRATLTERLVAHFTEVLFT